MAASAEAPLEDAALEAVAVFLRGSGYAGAAASLDAARRDRAAGAQGAGGGDAFAERLQALAASLGRLSAEGGRGAAQERGDAAAGAAGRPSRPPQSPARGPAARAADGSPSLWLQTAPLSAHYVAGRPGGFGDPGDDFDPSIPDLYRDDADPGYRMREVLESELTAALRDAQPAGFRPAFGGTAAFGCDGVSDCPAFGSGGCATASFGGVEAEPAAPAAPPCGDDDELMGGIAEAPASQPAAAGGGIAGLARNAGTSLCSSLGMGRAPSEVAEAPAPVFGGPAFGGIAEPAPVFGGAAGSRPPSHPGSESQAAQARRAQKAESSRARVPSFAFQQPAGAARAAARKEKAGTRSNFLQPDSGDPFYPAEMDGIVYDSFPLRVVFDRDKTGFEDTKEFPVKANSIIAARYQVQEVVGAAVFSRAVQCLDLHTNRMVCMKVIKNDKEYVDQSLDEIKLLRFIGANAENLDEKCCLQLLDCFYHKEHLIIVTELLRENLYEFSRFNRESGEEPFFTLGRVQRIAKQILTALEYTHSLCLIHADLKPENVLVKSYSRCEVKLIDFGSSCFVDDHLPGYVQSRAYRAPEVVLGCPYDQKIDMWSLACIIAELWTGKVLFHADCAQGVLARILGIIGPIPEHMMASGRFVPELFTFDGQLYSEVPETAPAAAGFGVSEPRVVHLYEPKASSLRQRMRTRDDEFLDFLTKVLTIDPAGRPTAAEALQHPWLSPGRYRDGIPA